MATAFECQTFTDRGTKVVKRDGEEQVEVVGKGQPIYLLPNIVLSLYETSLPKDKDYNPYEATSVLSHYPSPKKRCSGHTYQLFTASETTYVRTDIFTPNTSTPP
ncbi:hypothetical protein VNI00_019242, partial [Paramarasmius palmivorus]